MLENRITHTTVAAAAASDDDGTAQHQVVYAALSVGVLLAAVCACRLESRGRSLKDFHRNNDRLLGEWRAVHRCTCASISVYRLLLTCCLRHLTYVRQSNSPFVGGSGDWRGWEKVSVLCVRLCRCVGVCVCLYDTCAVVERVLAKYLPSILYLSLSQP